MSKKNKKHSPIKDNEDIVRAPYQTMVYTDQQKLELYKCFHPETGPRYFIENYVYVQHVKHGKVLMKLYPYQVGLLESYNSFRNSCSLISRQMGKSVLAAAYLLWYAMFNDDVTILVASNKHEGAMEIMHRIRFAYESVPDFLRAGVVTYNKKSITFDNGSRIISQATTANTGRGLTINLAYCLGGENTVTVRDKETQEEKVISLLELYQELNALQKQDITNPFNEDYISIEIKENGNCVSMGEVK